MKILLVDDDTDILNLIQVFLRDKDFDILLSGNGEEAYQIIRKERPDIAIIDGLIPGIHGFDLCKMVKEDTSLGKPPKIIVMSSLYKGSRYKRDVIKNYHADDFMEKPLKKEELLSRIEALM